MGRTPSLAGRNRPQPWSGGLVIVLEKAPDRAGSPALFSRAGRGITQRGGGQGLEGQAAATALALVAHTH